MEKRPLASTTDLRAGAVVAVVGVPFVFLMIHLGGWFLAGFLVAATAIATNEFYGLAERRAGSAIRWLGIPGASLLVLIAAHEPSFATWGSRALALLLVLLLATGSAVVFSRRFDDGPLVCVSATVVGALYTGGTLSFAILLRHLPEELGATPPGSSWDGTIFVLFPLVVAWTGDAAAYFVGSKKGRTRLAPQVSPHKTVAGAIAGLLTSAAMAIGAGHLLDALGSFSIPPFAWGLTGLALGAVGQLGDLAESILKREAGVKDSGTLLPGHGGALDRLDALFFTFPLGYVVFLIFSYWA